MLSKTDPRFHGADLLVGKTEQTKTCKEPRESVAGEVN